MTTLDDLAPAKPCGCRTECDHLPYDRLAEAAVQLGRVIDRQAEAMRSAIRATYAGDAKAGMWFIFDYAGLVPELLEGLDVPSSEADTAGAAK